MSQPPLIRYNVKDRGRKYLGKDRHFNIQKLCDVINGGATQERVRTRGMIGYLGHLPRRLAGLQVTEAAIVSGKHHKFKPALITTYLKAYPNGDIEHQSEFLDSEDGIEAARMWSQKIGGFSSAIKAETYDFHGFDYVLDPNYSNNRGYLLDSVEMIFDDVIASAYSEREAFLRALLEKKELSLTQVSEALNRCQADNENLIERLATGQQILDDASFSLPAWVATQPGNRLTHDVELFKNARALPHFQTLNPNQQSSISDTVEIISQLRRR